MESEKRIEWSSALDEDLRQNAISAVISPDAPWSLSAGPWSTESSVPSVLNQYPETQNYSTFIPSSETRSQNVQTEEWTEERSTSTNEDWESDMSPQICSLKDAMHHVVSKTDKTLILEVKYINAVKGRGLFAKHSICKGDFVVEYRGDVISHAELQRRQKRYHTSSAAFMFEFKWRRKAWCIDASREDGSFGRIVNDDHKQPNCKMKKIDVNGKPHLCLFALKDIKEGEEITYDYGGEDYLWRTQTTSVAANIRAERDSNPSLQSKIHDATGRNNSPQQIKDKDLQDSDDLFDSTPGSSDYYFTDTTSESDFDSDASLIPNQTKLQLLYDELDVDDSGSVSSLDCDTTPDKNHSLASEASGTEEPCSSQNAIDGVVVSAYQKSGVGRVYNKRHYCLYCSKPYAKMARHLESSHAKESDVAKALSFPKSSKERKKQLDYIRNRGNYAHNAAVIETGKGELVPYKRPPKEAQGKDFMHCAYCQGLFTRKVLWRHMRTCRLQPQSVPVKPGKNRVQSMCIYTGPVPSNMTKQLWEVISSMNPDPITDVIKNDKVIIDVGQHLLSRGGLSAKNKQCVREKMRELGRLVHNARRVTSLKTMEDCVNPKKYMETVKAVKYTCGYESDKFMIPSLAKKLGSSLVKVSKLLKAQGLISNNKQLVKNASEFQDVHQEKWNEMILATALRNIREAKCNVPTLIPFTEDVQKMHTHISQVQDTWYKSLSESCSTKAWMELAKACLAQVILFNRHRGGAVSSMPLSEFLSRGTSDPHEDVDWALSEVEKKFCRRFSMIIIRGEHGRLVPILLTSKMLCALELLVKQREPCGVIKDNIYMFARPEAMTHYRGSDCLRDFAKACGAKCPRSLTSTRVRKHLAILSTVLNMTDTEIDQLANFLGHNLKIQHEYCQLPEKTLQLAKICKVLMALEQGRLAEFYGKNLDEIVINPDEKVLESDWEVRSIQLGHCSSTVYEPIAEETLPPAERNEMPPPPKRQKPPDEEIVSGATAMRPLFKGKTTHKKNPWQQTEVQAVERHMMQFITSFTVPAKSDCEKCLKAEPEALKNRDWKNRAIEDCSIELNEQYEALRKQHAAEQEEHNFHVHSLEKTRDDRNHQYQGFIEKIESLQVKLELNSSKTTRKNFMVKRQELTTEKERMAEEKTRLAQELEDTEKKLKLLIEEQSQEKLSWEQEIADLRVEMETLCRQAEQASQTVLQDEIAALEMQKELALSQVEDWITDAEKYLNFLRLNPSQSHLHQRQKWEQNVAMVRSKLVGLKKKFDENHQLLQRGEQLDRLPSVSLPVLPPVPTLEMIMSPLQNPASHPVFSSGLPTTTSPPIIHPQLHSSITPPQRATPPLSAPSPQTTPYLPVTIGPQSAHIPNIYAPMTTHAPAPQIPMQNICQPQTSSHAPITPAPQILPHTHVGIPSVSHAPSAASAGTFVVLPNNPGASFQPQAAARLSQTYMPSTATRNSSPQPLPPNPAPAGKLDKLLERLGSHFPQCTRDQLTRVLQQIKSERGTMAGMSIDDLTQQVAQRLAQNQKPPLGPIAPPSGARAFPAAVGPIQRPVAPLQHPMRPHFRPPVAQVFHTRPPQPTIRKFCLMCQNPVDAGSQYNTNCSHTMHKDCVSVWLKTSKNNSCPFCPSK
ncbi:hypothetical protein QQF64_027760 [Cirrhinus molitorella]|uniref:SET domain-containing protein n=1 Tax=Cirrhinus molitorella TaxID=172907 RepID=A0ABR3NDA6_9TELE